MRNENPVRIAALFAALNQDGAKDIPKITCSAQ